MNVGRQIKRYSTKNRVHDSWTPNETYLISSYEQLTLNGLENVLVNQTKSLRIVVDKGTNWSELFRRVKRKVLDRCGCFEKLMNIVPQSQLVSIY